MWRHGRCRSRTVSPSTCCEVTMARKWQPDPDKSDHENEWDALICAAKAWLKKHKANLRADEGTFHDIFDDILVSAYDVLQKLKRRPDYNPERYTLFNSAYYAVMWVYKSVVARNIGAHPTADGTIKYDTYVREEDPCDINTRPKLIFFGDELQNKLNYMSVAEQRKRALVRSALEKGKIPTTKKKKPSVVGQEIVEELTESQYLDYVDDCAEFGIKPISRKEFEKPRWDRRRKS